MQELTANQTGKKERSRERGSILIVVIGIVTLISFGGVSLLQVCSGVHNQDIESKRNAFAFHAAESGVMMGTSWLRNRPAFPSAGTFSPFPDFPMNTMWVRVVMNASSNANGVRSVLIAAEVFDDPTDRTATHFMKRMRNTVVQNDFGRYNMFVNRLLDPNWYGFGGGKVFHGRFYWNDPNLRMALNNNAHNPANQNGVGVTFTGDVTVANTIQSTSNGNVLNLIDPSGNNFSYGLKFRDANVDAAYADKIFKGTFSSTTLGIAIPSEITAFASGSFGSTDTISLPASSTDQGIGEYDYRPTLTFMGNGSATYSYQNAGGAASMQISNVNQKIIYCQTNLNVKGIVLGNTAVVTKKSKSIAVIGDLVYADNDLVTGLSNGAQNNDVPLNSPNCLALVSGYNIYFNPRWKATPGGQAQAIVGTLNPGSGKMYLNAEMIMAHPDGVGNNWGCEYWIQSSPDYQYQLQICGNHVMNYWRPTNNDQTHGGVNINYGYDQRFALGMRPYGMPAIKTANNLWIVSVLNWQEENVF